MLRAVHPVLPCRDVKAAVAFYVEKLGFTLAFQDAEEPRYAAVSRDRVVLHLQWHDPKEWERVERPMLRFVVEDPDALYEALLPAGVYHSRTAVRDTPWGTREFAFYDPDGNGLTFYKDLDFPADPSGGPTAKALVPMAHVASVPRSIVFYRLLGFEVGNTHTPDGDAEPSWAWLHSRDAHLMVTRAGEPVVPRAQAVLFYLYCEDVEAMHAKLTGDGLAVGPIETPFFSPRGEFRLTDPDGYALLVAHT